MNRIDEEEEEEEDNTDISKTVDQFPSVESPPDCNISNRICSSKQTRRKNDRSKYQTTNRPSSLPPARHSSSLNENLDQEIKQRRRYASDSNSTNSTLLVTSFLQYLRNELRVTTSDKTTDYHRHKRQKSLSNINLMNSKISNENLLEMNDQNEILTLIDLLVLRVECLTNENQFNKKVKLNKHIYPTVAEIDQNLLEYLYYLFTKFTNEESDSSNEIIPSIMDKNNFVNVCQTLVRNGCFDISSASPDQTISEGSDQTLTSQTILHEYHADTKAEQTPTNEEDTWLVVDLQSEEPNSTSETICVIPTSNSDDQLLFLTNDIDKSYESVSSPSIYFSPNSSFIDLQNMLQEFDEINNQSIIENGSTLNVMNESKTTIISSNDDNQSSSIICTRLTNDDSPIENSEEIDQMSRREKKMQDRWSISVKNENNNTEPTSTISLTGIEFPQISVLRRKFSSASLTTNKKKINSDSTSTTTIEEINTSPTTIILDNTNPDQINELPLKDSSLSINTNIGKNNDDGQVSETNLDEEITIEKKQEPLYPPMECQIETITNNHNELVDNQQTK